MDRRSALKTLTTLAGAGTVGMAASSSAQDDKDRQTTATQARPAEADDYLQQGGVQFWLCDNRRRVYPTSSPAELPTFTRKPLRVRCGRHYKAAFQACYRNLLTSSAQIECNCEAPAGIRVRIRRVGFVPMQQLNTDTPPAEQEGIGKIPGLCPDPLFPDKTAQVGPFGTAVFWISIFVPKDAQPGLVRGKIQFKLLNRFGYMGFDNPEQFAVELPFELDISPVVVQPRKDFPVTIWLSADSIWEYYKIPPFSERFWELADKYIGNLTAHGVNVIYTPIFNIRAEKLKRPAQLLRVRKVGDNFEFDFSDVKRWLDLAKKHGADYVEFSHLFSPAPESAQYPQKIYDRWDGDIGDLLWPADTNATSDIYRKFLEQFLPKLKALLEAEGMLDKSLFHLADEPDGDAAIARYRKARALLKQVAPWIKVMDAMSDPRFATERLSDMPVPSIVTAHKFAEANCPAWAYYCCGPRAGYIQRLLDTPLWKIRTSGWLFYHLNARGFLHWGYNYWFKFCTDQIADPFADATNGAWPGMPYGDTFAVYPGENGPLDSIRWEMFALSLQDYALLQSAGISRTDPLLAPLKDYNSFPKDPEWIEAALDTVLAGKSAKA